MKINSITKTLPTKGWAYEFPFLVAFGPSGGPAVRCPIWGDRLGFKDATIVVPKHLYAHAIECIIHAEGGEPTRVKQLPCGKWAMRAEYQAW